MKKIKFELLLDELKLQTNFSIISMKYLEKNLDDKWNQYSLGNEDNRINNQYEFWYYLQNYVVALGNVSKLLFISRNPSESNSEYQKRKKDRDLFLRILEIDNNISLRNKKMRNILEHIDERIEEFSKKEKNIIANKNIGPSTMILIGDKYLFEDDADNLRNYLTDRKEFILFGRRFNLEVTFGEVIIIKNRIVTIQEKLDKGELDDLFS